MLNSANTTNGRSPRPIFAWLFSPGWASGVLYTLLIAALWLFYSFFNDDLISTVISRSVGEGELADNIVPALAAGAGFVGSPSSYC